MARKFLTPIDLNKLELQNASIQNLATAPGSPATGQVYFDTNDNKIKVWTGSAWENVGSSQEEIEDYINGLLAAGNGVELTYDDNGDTLTITNTGVLSLAGTANEVVVSASAGDVTISLPDTINANTTGNAATATALETARTISLSGDVAGSVSFDGTGNVDITTTVQADSVALGTDTTGDYVADVTAGTGISVTGTGEGASVIVTNEGVVDLAGTANEVEVSASVGSVTIGLPATINADTTGNAATATALETARTISFGGDLSGSASFDGTQDITINGFVDTDAAVNSVVNTDGDITLSASVGNITVGLASAITADVTGDLTGNADTATALETARTISVDGPVSGSASFDGTSNVTITTTQGADSVTLGTHTVGDYVATVSGTANEIEVTGTGEGAAVTVGLPDDVILTGDLTVGGNLTVSGSVTYVNTETIELADNILLFNSNATGSATEDAGIEIERGDDTNVSLLWDESSNLWTLTNDGTNYHAVTRKYSANVGNTVNTSFAIAHNLGTQDVTVQVYDNSTLDTVEVDVVRTDADTVTVSFATAPGSNAYRVVIVG